MTIADIQAALSTASQDPGPIDGIWGRRSIAACRAFQAANGLPVTGLPDAATLVALGIGAGMAPPLVWLREARSLLGLKETPGSGSTKEILDMARDLDIPYGRDDIPWCGLFVAHCIGATLPQEALPKSPLWARGWLKFGDPAEPGVGAVLVFWRDNIDGPNGHVGFYEGETDSHYLVLGGNQKDQVCSTLIDKHRLLKARWPRSAAGMPCEPLAVAGLAGAMVGGKEH